MIPELLPADTGLVRFKDPANASVTVPFEVKRRRRSLPRAQKAGYVKSTQFNNVAFIMARSVESETTQAWFWTAAWQQGEAQATAEAAAGLGRVFDDAEGFLASLDD